MKNFAHLKEDSPFYKLFELGLVPIKNSLLPNKAELEGSDETEVYMVDVDKITSEQFDAIIEILFLRAGKKVLRTTIRRDILLVGLPLRASQVQAVSTDSRAFL